MEVGVDSGCNLSVFERIDARIRGDERRHGLGEAGFGDLLRERLAEAADRHPAKRRQNQRTHRHEISPLLTFSAMRGAA